MNIFLNYCFKYQLILIMKIRFQLIHMDCNKKLAANALKK